MAAGPRSTPCACCRRAGRSRATGGAFDATVQPPRERYARNFSVHDADLADPPAESIARARGRTGSDAVSVARDRIALTRPGMAVALNGIAQGYVTDRIAQLLRGARLSGVLVDLGEARGLGRHPDGRPWRAAPSDRDGRPFHTVDLEDRALATLAPGGSFSAATSACTAPSTRARAFRRRSSPASRCWRQTRRARTASPPPSRRCSSPRSAA